MESVAKIETFLPDFRLRKKKKIKYAAFGLGRPSPIARSFGTAVYPPKRQLKGCRGKKMAVEGRAVDAVRGTWQMSRSVGIPPRAVKRGGPSSSPCLGEHSWHFFWLISLSLRARQCDSPPLTAKSPGECRPSTSGTRISETGRFLSRPC